MEIKLQSALEYLSTYSWAILIMSVAAVVLFTIANLSAVTPQTCILPAGLSCKSEILSGNGLLQINILQATQDPIKVTAIGCTTIQSFSYMSNAINSQPYYVYMPISSNYTFNIPCYSNSSVYSGSIGNIYNGYLIINYTNAYTLFPQTIYGKISTKVAESGNQSSSPSPPPPSSPGTLTMAASPSQCSSSAISPSSGSNSEPAGTVSISAPTIGTSSVSGGTCTFSSWTGSGTGSYSGSFASNSVMMPSGGSITETATYTYAPPSPYTYSGEGATTPLVESLSGQSEYFCGGSVYNPGNDYGTASASYSIDQEQTDSVGSAFIGQTSSGSCLLQTTSGSADAALSMIGINTATYTLEGHGIVSTGSFSYSSPGTSTYSIIFITEPSGTLTSLSLPAGCTELDHYTSLVALSYLIICSGQSAGSYSVTTGLLGYQDINWAVYQFT